jgi:NAD(P)-dependent dehydrogenase (short-subunit alcohol dehydrogenase family)
VQPSEVIIVTGAASGMGRAAATRWARQGHRVAAVDRSAEAIKELEAGQAGIAAFECDVTDEEAVNRTAGEIRARLGEVDRMVNMAGIVIPGRTGEQPPAEFRRTMEVNYFGTVHWVHAVLPGMRARRRGVIVNFSSIGGFLPGPGVNAYNASKFAVLGYTETLAEEVRREGIRVVCVCPPPVKTPLLDTFVASAPPRAAKLMRPMTPEAVIDALEKALSGRGFLVLPNATAKAMYVSRRLAPNLTKRLLRMALGDGTG